MLNDPLLINPDDQAAPKSEIATELTLKLTKPISLGTIEYTELQLTEPTVGQLKVAGKAPAGIEQLALLLQHNAKVPTGVVDKLCQRDFEAAARFFETFNGVLP